MRYEIGHLGTRQADTLMNTLVAGQKTRDGYPVSLTTPAQHMSGNYLGSLHYKQNMSGLKLIEQFLTNTMPTLISVLASVAKLTDLIKKAVGTDANSSTNAAIESAPEEDAAASTEDLNAPETENDDQGLSSIDETQAPPVNQSPVPQTAGGCTCAAPEVKKENTATKTGRIAKTGELLWKPVADKDGKLVVLLPERYNGKVKLVKVRDPKSNKVLDQGDFSGIANGNRSHYRFDKPGAKFPDGAILEVVLKSGETLKHTIRETSGRIEY